MEVLSVFQQLKKDVLLQYKEHYPFFEGNWKSFTSQDIQNLIDLIAVEVKQTVSEKWIYTHLKPEQNEKLPRKDMLDIFSQFVGFSGWDEYVFRNTKQVVVEEKNKKKQFNWKWIVAFFILIFVSFFGFQFFKKEEKQHIEIQDIYTKKTIENEQIKAVAIENNKEIPIEVNHSKIETSLSDSIKLKIKSPFYNEKTVIIKPKETTKIELQPNDYAMMLKAFMKADIKDWQTRKAQLQLILSSDLEVLVMLKNNLGTEYFNKEEFTELLVVPSISVKKMEVLEIQYANNKKINFIRIQQE
ncbi:hypothetical protein [Flavobacterium sp.]|uniref:hypothetical protein n=1 Tax=Flavobacterium sp. TaxID=239 RepID=UPI003529B75A